ncbi:MAG: hypothetical protein MUP64_04970 [Anaerolineae bacterium]|nr:hypothetical protein [Anaerolineae bacterium]
MERTLGSTWPKQQDQSPENSGRLNTLLLLIAVLVAFATYTYLLDAKSMWIDEGLTVYRPQLDVPPRQPD